MHNISRRNFVLSATAASAAFGLNGPLEFTVADLEAIDGTPIIDLKVAMRESPEA